MYVPQVSPLRRIAAVIAAFAMVLGILTALNLTTAAQSASAAPAAAAANQAAGALDVMQAAAAPAANGPCTKTSAGTISCPGGYTATYNTGGGTGGTGGGVGHSSDGNVVVTYGTVGCIYYRDGHPVDMYPIANFPTDCFPNGGHDAICNVYGANNVDDACTLPSVCHKVNNIPTRDITIIVIKYTTKTGNTTKTVTTVKGVCTIPPTKPVPDLSVGYCAVNVGTTLYYSADNASIIAAGTTGSATKNGLVSGSNGGGTAVDTAATQTITPKVNDDTWDQFTATCVDGKKPQRVDLPKDTVNGGTKLGYYRSTQLIRYVKCTIKTWEDWTKNPPEPSCVMNRTYPVYSHSRFTNTCLNGLNNGIDTDLAKYFKGSACTPDIPTYELQCTVANTKINGVTTTTMLTRSGADVPVVYATPSITGDVRNITNIRRNSVVDDGSTPFFGTDPNADNQFFKLFKGVNGATRMDFGVYNKVSTYGNTNYISYYWASDNAEPWSMTTTYRYHAEFKTHISSGSVYNPTTSVVWRDDDATCADKAKSPKVTVMRSVNSPN